MKWDQQSSGRDPWLISDDMYVCVCVCVCMWCVCARAGWKCLILLKGVWKEDNKVGSTQRPSSLRHCLPPPPPHTYILDSGFPVSTPGLLPWQVVKGSDWPQKWAVLLLRCVFTGLRLKLTDWILLLWKLNSSPVCLTALHLPVLPLSTSVTCAPTLWKALWQKCHLVTLDDKACLCSVFGSVFLAQPTTRCALLPNTFGVKGYHLSFNPTFVGYSYRNVHPFINYSLVVDFCFARRWDSTLQTSLISPRLPKVDQNMNRPTLGGWLELNVA